MRSDLDMPDLKFYEFSKKQYLTGKESREQKIG